MGASGRSPLERARSSAPRPDRSVALTVIDIEDVAVDKRSFVRRDEDDRVGKLLREAEATHRNRRHQSGRIRVPVKRVSLPVSVGPGATAFTRIPTSRPRAPPTW